MWGSIERNAYTALLAGVARAAVTVLSPRRVVKAYRVDPVTLESTPTEPDPQRVKEAIAYYQTAAAAFKQGRLQMPAAQ